MASPVLDQLQADADIQEVRNNWLTSIHHSHPLYQALHYALFYPRGGLGYHWSQRSRPRSVGLSFSMVSYSLCQ